MASLLAVLGKQWLLYYSSVGQHGTVAERGAERQRKFDGIRRWRFNMVMQVFPLLLQLSLLLFATALSIYLWTIHHFIGGTVFVLTALGVGLYTAMLISAVVSPDSPYQTSLSFLLGTILARLRIPQYWGQFCEHIQKFWCCMIAQVGTIFSSCWIKYRHTTRALEPLPIFDSPGDPSKEAYAVVWALETSTDPVMVHTVAELIPELIWPVDLSIQPAIKRLDDTFRSCIYYKRTQPLVLDGMDGVATTCIQAFWAIDLVAQEEQRMPELWTSHFRMLINGSTELQSIQYWIQTFFGPRAILDTSRGISPPIILWTLRFLAGRPLPEDTLDTILQYFDFIPTESFEANNQVIAEFLFCINSVLSDIAVRDRSVRDKR
jgi:hypothetical protein